MGVSETIFSPSELELNYKYNLKNLPGSNGGGIHSPKVITIRRWNRNSNKNLVQKYLRRSRNSILEKYNGDRRALQNPYLLQGLQT